MEDAEIFTQQRADNSRLLAKVRGRLKIAQDERGSRKVLNATYDEWLQRCDRMLNKEHEPDQLEAFPDMTRYFGLGVMRAGATTAWMRDLLVNTGDIPVELSPTEKPELPKDKQDAVKQKMMRNTADYLLKNGIDPFSPVPPEGLYNGVTLHKGAKSWLEKAAAETTKAEIAEIKRVAAVSLDLMKQLMKDYAQQGNWKTAHAEFLHYGNAYPVKVMCLDWIPTTTPHWNGNKFEMVDAVAPYWRAVKPHDCYFAPDATSANDGGFFIEKMQKTQSQIATLKTHKAYKAAEIDALMNDWENQSSEGGNSDEQIGYDTGYLSSQYADSQTSIVVYRHIGEISGKDLADLGIAGHDANKTHQVDVEWTGNHVIKCEIVKAPQGHRGYYSSNFKRTPSTWFGTSPLMHLYDAQITLNQWNFFINNNFYAAQGPMMEVNAGAISSGADFFFDPYRSFTTDAKQKLTTGQKPITMHQVQPVFNQQQAAFMQRLRLADYECGIPSEAYGPSLPVGGGQTLGEITLRWGASLRSIKDSVQNDDQMVIEPIFKQLYYQLMQHSDDPRIKADCNIKATGTVGLMQRETVELRREKMLPQLQAAAQMMPDKYTAAFESALNEQFTAMGLGDVLPDDPRIAGETDALIRGLQGTNLPADGRSKLPSELTGMMQ